MSDRRVIAELRSHVGHSEAALWPTCLHCTTEKNAGMPRAVWKWIPVEQYDIDPPVFAPMAIVGGPTVMPDGTVRERPIQATQAKTFYPPRKLKTRGWFAVRAKCHGSEQMATIDVPFWWTTHHVLAAIQNLHFFGAEKNPTHHMRDTIR